MTPPADKPFWQVLEELLNKLKPAQRALGESLVDLARHSENGRIPLAELLENYQGGTVESRALANLRQSKKRLNKELAALNAGIEFAVDESGKLETRGCYLRAPAGKTEAINQLAEALNYDRDQGKHVAPKAQPLVVEIPISYSHVNKKLVRELHTRLQVVLDARKTRVRYLLRRDERDTELASPLDPQIAALFRNGAIALFMLSPDFLNSTYCQKKEVPKFIDAKGNNREAKRAICVAVAVEMAQFQHLPAKFTKRLIAFHEGTDERLKSWRQLWEEGLESEKDAFLHHLADEIIKAAESLERPDDTPPDGTSPPNSGRKMGLADRLREWVVGDAKLDIDPQCFTPLHARYLGTPERKDEEGLAVSTDAGSVDLIAALLDWLRDGAAPPFCALLGEYGTGKTVSCQMLAHQVNTLRQQPEQRALPLALYFDLRRIDPQQLTSFAIEPVIEQLLNSADQAHKLKARELIDWVRVNPALVIFDGLDEVLVHLNPRQGRDFIHALWAIYPPAYWRARTDLDKPDSRKARQAGAPRNSKLLLSCRSHYFRTIADERALFVGQDREAIRASDYRAFLLLPFNDAQIIDYLQRHFPQRDPQQTLDLIASIHNLQDLARRPVLLKHIGAELLELERRKIAGKTVNSAVLYSLFVDRWLRRDDTKHQFSLPHKQVLMEQLAAELSRRGVRELAYDRVEDWLDRFMARQSAWESAYRGKDREILKEDLRTATFIVRPDEKKFRFAHSSLQEYFLANYLLHALMAGDLDGFHLPLPSPETFDFFAELWQVAVTEDDDRLPAAQRTLAALLEQALPGRSETAFAAWLALQCRSLPSLQPARFDLRGCDLSGWRVDGGAAGLVLGGIDFSDANLARSHWQHVRLAGAQLDRAKLASSEWHDADLSNIVAPDADLDGVIFRHCKLTHADLSRAASTGATYLFCERSSALLPPLALTRVAPSEISALSKLRPQMLAGHSGGVRGCAFSADGQWLASAGSDGTVRLWDVAGRREAHRFSGHSGGVWGCAFSADGQWLASAGSDGTVRLWDVAGRREAHRFSGHSGRVLGCAFSADGQWLASAGADGTVRLWDVAGRREAHRFSGHSGGVRGCAFSADGRWLASAGSDGTVRLWDVAGRREAHRFSGHSGGVWGCAFSADGRWLASAGADGTVRLWDVAGRREAHRFSGHSGRVRGCAFSADGQWLASAGSDGTVRLWDVAGRREAHRFSGHSGEVLGCTFSADGQWLASAGSDGTVRLWAVAGRRAVHRFSGHSGEVLGCTFSADGQWLASAGEDGTVRLWDVAGRWEAHRFSGHSGGVWGCTFSADGQWLVSAGEDGTVRLWDVATGTCRAMLCHFSQGEGASIDLNQGRIIAATSNAWRYLGYSGVIDGEYQTFPAEIFGPLLEMRPIGAENA